MRNGIAYQLPPLVRLTAGTVYGSLPTPTAGDAKGSGSRNTENSKAHAGVSLTDWVRGDGGKGRRYPTPTATDATLRAKTKAGQNGMHSLQLSHLANSGALETENPVEAHYELLPTPTTQDASNNAGPSQFERNSLPLNAVAGGPLNPNWVEWLMGYPPGWTDLER